MYGGFGAWSNTACSHLADSVKKKKKRRDHLQSTKLFLRLCPNKKTKNRNV